MSWTAFFATAWADFGVILELDRGSRAWSPAELSGAPACESR
ncbi:hypothetical protein Pd630_LPD06159 [Rhodococcus opacus PD630]|nr:hypothetical protein Pd630_LPD06159 [Rhodococcus opacus PD630]